MDDATSMRVIERISQFSRVAHDVDSRQGAARKPLGECVTFDVLHDQKQERSSRPRIRAFPTSCIAQICG